MVSMKQILVLALLVVHSLLVAHPLNTPSYNPQNLDAKSPTGTIVVELTLAGHHLATWDVIPGAGNYSVSILNLTTNQTHALIVTANNSAAITGLVSGNTYKFTVVKNGNIIIDIIDIG